ncbi:hypothetical protein KFL_003750160 [Klebsormidium nitens]|uniref:TraB family protein n=1 Tax=Klebsormidium nitens TaxID=105231 RepID=A0A1Y1IG78_KLENI|nr:hypothetical protein KFL_003750160 [Klebsormidium nitens]|eukprot:GAQ87766.1 hypothetical protein KFL_003750160 [Klebsormidium nitens]
MVVQRPEDYVERREDGYREPETIFLVGTAHLSRRSATDVTRVMNAVKPENVVVELCRSRAAIMYVEDSEDEAEPSTSGSSNLMSFSGRGSFNDTVGRSLELGGRPAMAMRLALGSISDRLSESVGVKTGVEWRAARVAAEELGSQIVLGDRPIEITLQRAWTALGFFERFRFLWFVFYALTTPGLTMTEDVMDLFKDDDALSVAFKECAATFPGLMGPLTHEREMYLAWSMKRSKAVNGTKQVVGVMGRGHMRGVVYYLTHSQDKLRFKDLVGERKKLGSNPLARMPPFVRNLIIEFVAGGLLWWLWTKVLSKYDVPFHF